MKILKLFVILILILDVSKGIAKADFTFGEPTQVPNVNGPNSDGSPQISRDGLELYYNYDGLSWKCSRDIWVSKRSTNKAPWSAPIKLDAPVNSSGPECSPSLSADGLELYFSDGYPNNTNCTPNPGGYGHSDLWVAKRTSKDDPWGTPENLGSIVNSESVEDTPCISADGLELYFVHDINPATFPESTMKTDIYVTTRATKDALWGEPVKLGLHVNSSQYEWTPFISADGLALFFSRGLSKSHIYVCRRATTSDPWGWAEFFAPVNSGSGSYHTQPGETEFNVSFSEGDSTIYFTRGSNTQAADFDIWQVEVTPIVDFNSDGFVNTNDLLILIYTWSTNETLCDITPMPFGDGVVDMKDLEVFMKYWEQENMPEDEE